MIELVPFQVEHALEVNLRHDIVACGEIVKSKEYLETLATAGPAFTGVVDGRVVGCGGVGILWNGVGEAWMILDKSLDGSKMAFHKLIKKSVLDVPKQYGLHRMQCSVAASDARARKWIKRLGFNYEGLMRHYGPDKSDYMLYARCF